MHRAAIAETQRPRMRAHLVHRVQMRGGLFVGLSARQEHDTGQQGRHGGFQAAHGRFGDLVDTGLLGAALAGNHHARLEDGAFEHDVLLVQRTEQRTQGRLGHVVAHFDIVIAVHQDFGLDHRHDARFLAQRRIACERMAIGFDTGAARHVLADRDDRAPLGELGAEPGVFGEAVAQAVEALGDQFAGKSGQCLRTLVHLDARQDAVVEHDLGEGYAGLGRLTDGFVIEDRTGDVFAELGRRQQHFAIGASVFLSVFDLDRIETLLDRGVGFVDGDDALARCDHRLGDNFQFFDTHG